MEPELENEELKSNIDGLPADGAASEGGVALPSDFSFRWDNPEHEQSSVTRRSGQNFFNTTIFEAIILLKDTAGPQRFNHTAGLRTRR